jgi:hypothetical protein
MAYQNSLLYIERVEHSFYGIGICVERVFCRFGLVAFAVAWRSIKTMRFLRQNKEIARSMR